MKLTLLISLLTSGFAFASEGFRNGHRLGSTIYRGQAHVVCTGTGHTSRYVYCNAIGYSPDSHDVFVSDQKIDAKKVDFVAHHEDGSSRKKSVKYRSDKGRTDYVNLAVSSLFQKPLLEHGINRVKYQMKNKKKVLKEGQLTMELVHLGNRQCRPSTVYAHNYNDCQNDTFVCDQYFHQTTCN